MTDVLKPCPFCGGEAILKEENNIRLCDETTLFFIRCVNCGSTSHKVLVYDLHYKKNFKELKKKHKQEAIEAWNRRAN